MIGANREREARVERWMVGVGWFFAWILPGVVAAQLADLQIWKSDGVATAVPGQPITYTVTVTNAGPDPALGAIVSDVFPAALVGVVWTCSASPGSSCTPVGSGNISDAVDVLVGGTLTYTVNGTIDPGATGSISNTATVTVLAPATDPMPSNNSSTDTDLLTPQADLGVTKTDFSSSAVPGTWVTYTVTVVNNGPSHATGAQVIDSFPPELQSITWTCAATPGSSCSSSGSGNISDTVTIRASGALTYSISAWIDPAATGVLVNSASVNPPPGVSDPGPSANSDTDTTLLTPQANLAVSKTNGTSSVTAGLTTTYQILITNTGPSDAPGTAVQDFFPSEISSAAWSCVAAGGASCTPSGTGDIDELVDLPAGSSVLFTVVASVDPCASGFVTNGVDVVPDFSVVDPDTADNSSSDTDSIIQTADLALSVSDSPDPVLVCNLLSYQITVRNIGPSCASGIAVTNTLPAGVPFLGTSGSCSVSGASQNCLVNDLAPGDVNTFVIQGLVDRSLRGAVVVDQTAVTSVTSDPVAANNAIATTTEIKPRDPYTISLTAAPRYLRIGGQSRARYRVRVASLCDPMVDSEDVLVRSVLPVGLSFRGAEPLPTSSDEAGAEFEFPLLAGGESVDLEIEAELNEDAEPGAELVHSVQVVDSLGLGETASQVLYVRPLPDVRGRLVVKLAVPRKISAGVQLPSRLVVDNKSGIPAEDVEAILVLPSELTLVLAVPPPNFELDFGELRELHWNFPAVKRKQVIRLWHLLPADLFPGEVLNFVAEVEDSDGNLASNRRDVSIRMPPRAR